MKFRLAVIALTVAVALAGCGRDGDEPRGTSVDADAGGHRLRMLILGHGKPTVILESGAQGGLGWELVRDPVARFATVVTYDRAGHGQSGPGPQPRDARQVASELRTALRSAGLNPPYVLVGQSLGGPFVRVFAATYPQDVCGLVLVDPSRVDHWETFDAVHAWYAANRPEDWPRVEAACNLVPFARSMVASGAKGVETMLGTLPAERRDRIRNEWLALMDAAARQQSSVQMSGGTRDEYRAIDETARQAVAARPLPRVPTILIAEGQPDLYMEATASLTPDMRMFNEASKRWKLAHYQDWVNATPGARLIVAKRSGHNIQQEDPQVVVDAIRQVVSRPTAPSPVP